MDPITDCYTFIDKIKIAIKKKDKKLILDIYEANEVNWDNVIPSIADNYDYLVDEANEILHS